MKLCPNPECRYRKRHGSAAEYRDQAATCSDCGAALVDAPAAPPPAIAGAGAAPAEPRAARSGPGPWAKLGVTIACCAVSMLGTLTPLPGTWDLQRSMQPSGGLLALFNVKVSAPQLSLMALGFTPILWAFVLIELAAVAVPAWRPLRIGGYQGRAALRRWVIPFAALLAFVQSVGIANHLRSLGGGSFLSGVYVGLPAVRPWVPWVAVFLLPLGTLLFALLADTINRWGLGHGYSCLLLAALLPGLSTAALQSTLALRSSETGGGLGILLVAALGACVLGALALLRRGPFRLEPKPFAVEIPPSGLDPVAVAASLALLPVTVASLFGAELDPRAFDVLGSGVVSLVLVGSLGAALSILYSQPRRVARVWHGRAPSEAEVGAAWGQVAAAAVRGTILLLALRSTVVVFPFLNLPFYADLTLVLVPIAVVLDLGREWRFRCAHPRLAPAWPVHRVYAVQPALQALKEAGIPAFPRGLHHRTLLQLFGPHVPVTLLVPEEKAEEAARVIGERLAEPGEPAR